MRRIIIIAIFIISTPSYGCICWNESFPLTYLNRNDTLPKNQHHYIIKGIVIDTQVGANVYNRWGHGNLVNIKVLEYWPNHAIVNDTITIMNDDHDCASGFLQDSTYLIGAWTSNRYLGTDQCQGTELFSEYAHLVQQLGESGIPRTDQRYQFVSDEPSKRAWSNNVILIIAFCFSLLLNIILLIRRKWHVRNSSHE